MKLKLRNLILSALLVLFTIAEAYSRAGGGGGHSSGGGGGFSGGSGGGGGFGTGVAIGWLLGSSFGRIVLVILIIVFIVYSYNQRKNSGGTDLVSDNSAGPQGEAKGVSPDFVAANQNFDQEVFISKVDTAFMAIQDAWMRKDLGKVRKWISDGVYQRFTAQFKMMSALDQVNTLSNIKIHGIRIESAEQEGEFSIITASVYFSDDDKFISNKYPQFNESFSGDTATEYWTFIKKTSVAEKDLYHSNNCPNCGYQLKDDGGEVSKCESCGTVTYLGDYDWVLCEITQEDDYARNNYRMSKNDPNLAALYANKDEHFCIQMMEDKASNAIMQYFVSHTTHDLSHVHRFTDDNLFAAIEQSVKAQEKYVFNRLYLNEVSMISCIQANGMWLVTFNIFYSSMRLRETPNGIQKIDDTVIERSLALTLSKKVGAVKKTELWSFACPSCGAPYTDTTITKCSYCDAQINSPNNDWVMVNLGNVE